MDKKLEQFFLNAVSNECNYLDKNTIKTVYLGIVRAAIKVLRERGRFRLPDFIDISIEDYPEKNMTNRDGTGLIRIPETKRVKVSVDYKLKQYFKP